MENEKNHKTAAQLHENVPPDWYFSSIKKNKFQRYWHKRRFEEVAKFIDKTPKGKILDIGSADGVFTKVILDKSKAKQIIGIDVLKTSVSWANKHWKKYPMRFRVGDAHKLGFKANTFDAVFALEVMEHVFKPQIVFKEIKRVLRKNGYVIVLVPSDNTLFNIIWWFVTHFAWARIWPDCHVQSFSTKHTLADELKKA